MKPLITLVEKLYGILIKVGTWLQPVFLLVFRLAFGWQFFIDGRGKLIHHPDIVDYFTSLHIPMPDLNAWFVGGLECFGGIFLILGLASRPLGLMLTVNMIVAYLAEPSDREKVFNMFSKPDDFLHADPFFFLLTSIIVFVFGSGPISTDYLLGKCLFKRDKPASQ